VGAAVLVLQVIAQTNIAYAIIIDIEQNIVVFPLDLVPFYS
jgi:hypothetical protein